jgi:hypothetical protein
MAHQNAQVSIASEIDLTGKRIRLRGDITQDATGDTPEFLIAHKGVEGTVERRSPYPSFQWVVHIPTTAHGKPVGFTEDVHVLTAEIEVIGDDRLTEAQRWFDGLNDRERWEIIVRHAPGYVREEFGAKARRVATLTWWRRLSPGHAIEIHRQETRSTPNADPHR